MEDPQQTNSDQEINKENVVVVVESPKPQEYDGNVRLKCKTCQQIVVCDKFYFGGYYFLAPHPTDDKYSFICINCSPDKKPVITHHQKSWVLTGACALKSLELMVGWRLYECSEVESFIDSHFDQIAPGRVRDLNNKQNWRHVFRGQVSKSDDICREYIGDNLFYSLFRNGREKPTQQAEYIIDKILTERETNEEKEYKVKWVGFAKRYATWEKESHINTIDHFGEMLKEYITNKQNQVTEEEEEESDDEEDEDFEIENEEENEPESESENEKEIQKQKIKKERKYSSILNAETESESDGEFARRARNKRQRTSSSSSISSSSSSSISSTSSSKISPTRSRTRLSQNFSPSLSPSFSLPPAPTARYLPPSPPTLRQIKKEKRDKERQERENKAVTSEDETEQYEKKKKTEKGKGKDKVKEKENNTTSTKHQFYKIKCGACASLYTAKEVGEVVPSPNCVDWKFTCAKCSRSRSHCFSFDPNKISQVASRALFNLHVRDTETEFFSADQIMAFVQAHPNSFKFTTPISNLRKSFMSNPAPCVARKFVGSGLYQYVYPTKSSDSSSSPPSSSFSSLSSASSTRTTSNSNLSNSSNSSKSPSTKSQTTKSTRSSKFPSPPKSSSKSSNSLETNLSNKNDPDVFILWMGTDDIIGFVRCDLSKPLSSLRELLKTNGVLKDKFLFVYKKAPVRLPQEQSIFIRECTFPCDDGFQIYAKQE